MGGRILVIGKNGSAQAVGYRLARDAIGNLVRDVLVSPGNDGMSSFQTCVSPEHDVPAGTVWMANRIEASLVILDKETKENEGLDEMLRGQGQEVVGPTLRQSLRGVAFDPNQEHPADEQISVMALCNGYDALLFPPLKTYFLQHGSLRIPMASVGPFLQTDNDSFLMRVKEEIFLPALLRMQKIGRPIAGPLMVRLVVRGDDYFPTQMFANFTTPETQTYMYGVKADLKPIFSVIANGESLSRFGDDILMKMQPTATICVATRGYPEEKIGGDTIDLADFNHDHGMIFFDSVKRRPDRQLETVGGQVLSCTGSAETIGLAIQKSYEILQSVRFTDAQYLKIS